jgi:hypothetical protein
MNDRELDETFKKIKKESERFKVPASKFYRTEWLAARSSAEE